MVSHGLEGMKMMIELKINLNYWLEKAFIKVKFFFLNQIIIF